MPRSLAFLLLIFVQNCFGQGQIDEGGVRRNAVAINSFETTDSHIADIFKTQKLILVGEIHGTAEPSEFVNFLVDNLKGNGRNIYVGLEISPQDIVAEKELHDSAALSKCSFFRKESFGKASRAWFNLIYDISKLSGVHLFFFDITKEQAGAGAQHRDSLMYVNVKSKMLRDTGAVYICLSGNFHNVLTADRFPVPMGNYFLQDKDLNLSMFNLVAFNQEYVEGSGYFNTGGGTLLHTLENSDYLYTLTNMRNYFSFTHELIAGDYNGILFTHHVTPSYGVK